MVAINGFNKTTNNDLVPSEVINQVIIPEATHARIYEMITWVAPVSGAADFVWPRWDAPSAEPTTHTESDTFSAANYGTSSASVTGTIVGTYAFLSDELQATGTNAGLELRVARMFEKMRDKIDLDVLALFVGATNASDNSGSNLSLTLWETALAAYMAQNPLGPRHAFVGSNNQIRDFRGAIRAAGGAALVQGSGMEVFNGLPVNGYVGNYMGIEIYEGNTTQYDGTNDAGGFCSCAPRESWLGPNSLDAGGQFQAGSGLGLAMWPLRGVYGISPQTDPAIDYQGVKLVASAMYGAKITAPHLVRTFISKKAAA